MAALRAATADAHALVDRRYGRFDLTDRQDYSDFLRAHALALPGVECAVVGHDGLPPLRPRCALIAADLGALGRPMPQAMGCAPPVDDAAAFGMAYVIEGSRLGGTMLARTLPEGWPASYLSASHRSGEWRGFLVALDKAAVEAGRDAAVTADGPWIDRAIAAARAVFARYAAAADQIRIMES